ncbi:MAG: hypothetical protein ACRDZ3_19725 [Acidimicrobiia bacterium]
MPAAVALSALALVVVVIVLARVAIALDAVELNLRSTVTTIRALHRTVRESGRLAEAVGHDASEGEATLNRLEQLKARGDGSLG